MNMGGAAGFEYYEMKFWPQLDRFPPVLCRLLAKGQSGPLTTAEIAEKSSLSLSMIEALSQMPNWDGVYLYTCKAFTAACGVDFDNLADMRRVRDYLRHRPTFQYLRVSPMWKNYYLPMLIIWLKTPDANWKPLTDLRRRLSPITKAAPALLKAKG
jgi:hypothetical protein